MASTGAQGKERDSCVCGNAGQLEWLGAVRMRKVCEGGWQGSHRTVRIISRILSSIPLEAVWKPSKIRLCLNFKKISTESR